MDHEQRRQILRENWAFQCTCSLCRSSPEAIDASASRSKRIAEIRRKLAKDNIAGHYNEAISHAHELFGLAKQAGLLPLVPEFNDMLARLYQTVGDAHMARKYANLALQGWLNLGSVDVSHLENTRHFLDSLEL